MINIKYIFLLFLSFIIFACGKMEMNSNMKRQTNEYSTFDAASNLSKSDFYDVLDSKDNNNVLNKRSTLQMHKLIKKPTKPDKMPDKLISISVTEEVSLKDVLLEIGRMANLDIQISPKINSSIIFSAKNKPLPDILENITEIANVRYKDVNGILVFEVDDPYVETYNVNFINLDRSSTSSKSSSSSINGSGSASSKSSSSSFSLSAKSNDNLWDEITSSIKQIVSEDVLNAKLAKSKSKNNNMIMPATQEQVKGKDTKDQDLLNENKPVPPNQNNVLDSLQQQSSSSGGVQQNGQTGAAQQQQSPLGQDTIAVNKQGGLIAVFASKKAHKKLEKYLKILEKKMMAQVLIEVKILEVTLDSAFQNGIDWSSVAATLGSLAISASTGFASNISTSTVLTPFTITGNTGSGTATINLLNQFGTVRTILSPRLNATNNQTSYLSRAENKVYFNMSITNNFVNTGATISGSNQQFTVAATPQTVPIGTDLAIHPVIDFDRREILMNIRPSISSLSGTVNDPAFEYVINSSTATNTNTVASNYNTANKSSTSGLHNTIPQTTAKTFDTMVRIKDGDMVIMGGFTQHINSVTESGLPFISDIPFIGSLFKQKYSTESVVETVVIIKATIIDDGENNMEESDKRFYNKMSNYSRKKTL